MLESGPQWEVYTYLLIARLAWYSFMDCIIATLATMLVNVIFGHPSLPGKTNKQARQVVYAGALASHVGEGLK